MSVHLERQVSKLKKMILALGAQVEEAVQNAIQAIHDRDADLAQRVIEHDEQIDLDEVEFEEECLHTLALYQPVAFDLRYVIASLKINNELERIGDLAVNIAEQAVSLAHEPSVESIPYDLHGMTRRVRKMLKESLDALVNIDPDLAEQVRAEDDHVDKIHREMYESVEKAISDQVEHVEQYIHLLSVSRNLERTADHCVNITEDVIYMAKGDIRRHSRPHPLLERAAVERPTGDDNHA